MCLNPIKIRNRSVSFGMDNFQKLYFEVPCGKCAECLELMRSQWYLRNYWQCRLCYDSGGYILFDTLTYSDENLPHLLSQLPEQFSSGRLKDIDYPCFSFVDIRNFMKRLRVNLTRAGYDVKHCLKYFLASEYGTDERYTHRPHYHVLFYYVPNGEKYLLPEDLSIAIDAAWQLGRTDGVPYRGKSYVVNHNVFGSSYDKNSDENLRAVACYVAKYVTKDSSFQNVIDSRIEVAMKKLVGDTWNKNAKGFKKLKKDHEEIDINLDLSCDIFSPELSEWAFRSVYSYRLPLNIKDECLELFKKVRRACSQFHRQSQGFGMYGLDPKNFDLDEVVKSGVMVLPDKFEIKKEIPIPMYYSRKLFSVKVRDENGKYYWIPSELGKRYRSKRTYTSVSRLTMRFDNWYKNLSDEDKQFVVDLLGDRTFTDLATYSVFYRGRILDGDRSIYGDLDMIIDSINLFDPIKKTEKYVIVDDSVYMDGKYYMCDLKEFSDMMVINDHYFDGMIYEGFDQLLMFYQQTIKKINKEKQDTFDKKEALNQELKVLKQSIKKLLQK